MNIYRISRWKNYAIRNSKGTLSLRQEKSSILVPAKTKEDAISLYNFALQMSEDSIFNTIRPGKVEKIAECQKRQTNSQGKYICGEPWTNSRSQETGAQGMCCIEGYAPYNSEECPYYPYHHFD